MKSDCEEGLRVSGGQRGLWAWLPGPTVKRMKQNKDGHVSHTSRSVGPLSWGVLDPRVSLRVQERCGF